MRKGSFRRAQWYAERGAWRKAAALYGQVLASNPSDRGAWLWRGVALGEVGAFAEAREHLAKAEALDPGRPIPRLFLARVIYDSGDVAEAVATLEGERNEQARALLAACLVRLGDADAARRIVAKGLPYAPWVLARLLAAIEEAAQDGPVEASTDLAFLEEKPGWFARVAWGRHLRRGLVHLRGEQWEKALRAFHRARHVRPDDPRAGYGLGIALYYLNRFEESERHLSEVVERLGEPFFSDALATLGKIDLERGRLAAAVLRLRRAVAAGAATEENYYALGLTFLRAGKPGLARSMFGRCASPDLVRQRLRTQNAV